MHVSVFNKFSTKICFLVDVSYKINLVRSVINKSIYKRNKNLKEAKIVLWIPGEQ